MSSISPDERTIPLATHILMVLSVVTGFTGIVGVLMAYAFRDKVSDDVRSHLEFAIHTFWIGLIAFVAMFAMAFSFNIFPFAFVPVVSRLVFLLAILWVAVRSIIGLVRLHGGNPIPNPGTLWMPSPA